MAKKVLVPLADGFEEIESLTVVDILKRAEIRVITAGLRDGLITGRSGVRIQPDLPIHEAVADDYDMLVLPGGMPASATLRDDPVIQALLIRMDAQEKNIAAICAAPIALDKAGLLKGAQFTSYPGMKDSLPSDGYREERVVRSGRLVTSRSPGTAMEFALELVRVLIDEDKAQTLADEVLARI